MKNFKAFEIFWRECVGRQCMYLTVIMMMSVIIFYMTMVDPAQKRITSLMQQVQRIEQKTFSNDKKENTSESMKTNASCQWEKKHHAWQMQGSFAVIYDCVLQEKSTETIASMRFEKNILGVRIVLGFDENPA